MSSDRTRAKRMSMDINLGNIVVCGIMLSEDKRTAVFSQPNIPTLRSNKEITRETLRKYLLKFFAKK